MTDKKILLIAFKYPQYSEVGGYRWTKFSKYFAENGCKIHVVTVKWNKRINQSWHNDVINKNITIHRIPSLYCHNLKYYKFSSDFFGMVLSKLRNQFIKLINLFYFVDEAQYWGKKLIPFCIKLIESEKIRYVIASGAPFMANYWASNLKREMPQIKLIHDFKLIFSKEYRFGS